MILKIQILPQPPPAFRSPGAGAVPLVLPPSVGATGGEQEEEAAMEAWRPSRIAAQQQEARREAQVRSKVGPVGRQTSAEKRSSRTEVMSIEEIEVRALRSVCYSDIFPFKLSSEFVANEPRNHLKKT